MAEQPTGSSVVGRVPQVGQDGDAAALDLGSLGVLVLVDEVLVDAQVHQLVDLRLLPRLAEGGQVLAGVAVEEELVGDGLERLGRRHLLAGAVVGGKTGQHVPVGVERIEQPLPDGFPLVQRHGALPGSIVVGSVTVSVFCGSGDRSASACATTVRPATTRAAGRMWICARLAGEQLQPGASGALAVAGALRGRSSRARAAGSSRTFSGRSASFERS